jgi:hypothetical protein
MLSLGRLIIYIYIYNRVDISKTYSGHRKVGKKNRQTDRWEEGRMIRKIGGG